MQPELRPIQGDTYSGTQDIAVRQNKVLRNTYMLLAVTLIPTAIGALLGANLNLSFMRTSPMVSFIAILAIYFVLGMFLDGIGMLMLTLPVVYPAVLKLGYDPIWFGVIIVKLVEICLVTPPVGLNCYVVNGVRPDIPLSDIFQGVWPFVVADLIVIAFLYAFPDVVTFLPNTMFGKG